MARDPNIQALADCGQAVLAATNGHHRRWAIKRCTDALVRHGTPPAIADMSAQAMCRVAEGIKLGRELPAFFAKATTP